MYTTYGANYLTYHTISYAAFTFHPQYYPQPVSLNEQHHRLSYPQGTVVRRSTVSCD